MGLLCYFLYIWVFIFLIKQLHFTCSLFISSESHVKFLMEIQRFSLCTASFYLRTERKRLVSEHRRTVTLCILNRKWSRDIFCPFCLFSLGEFSKSLRVALAFRGHTSSSEPQTQTVSSFWHNLIISSLPVQQCQWFKKNFFFFAFHFLFLDEAAAYLISAADGLFFLCAPVFLCEMI